MEKKMETVTEFIFLGSKVTADGDCNPEKALGFWKKNYDHLDSILKKQRHNFVKKGPYSQCYGFSSSQVWMLELNHNESWALKNWCFWTVVLEKTLESLLNCKEIKPVS